MQLRRLGRTDLSIAPLVLGGNVFGWTADKAASFAVLDRFAEAGLNAIDTADVYSAWAPGNKGGEFGDDDRRMDEVAQKPRPDDHRHQGRLADGQGQGGLVGALHRRGGRSLPEASADQRDRPVFVALARHGDALRRDARRLSAPDRARQDPLVRRLEPHRAVAGGRARARRRLEAARATRRCSRNTISPTGPVSNPASPICACAKRSESSPISASPRGSCPANTEASTI